MEEAGRVVDETTVMTRRMFWVAMRYFKDGELTWFKVRQYGSLRKLISQ